MLLLSSTRKKFILKTIFITGATSGFGEAIAEKFAQNDEGELLPQYLYF